MWLRQKAFCHLGCKLTIGPDFGARSNVGDIWFELGDLGHVPTRLLPVERFLQKRQSSDPFSEVKRINKKKSKQAVALEQQRMRMRVPMPMAICSIPTLHPISACRLPPLSEASNPQVMLSHPSVRNIAKLQCGQCRKFWAWKSNKHGAREENVTRMQMPKPKPKPKPKPQSQWQCLHLLQRTLNSSSAQSASWLRSWLSNSFLTTSDTPVCNK